MGCCGGGGSEENKELAMKSRDIDKKLKQDRAQAEKEVKLLLLGAGESGKSTFVKQMRIIYENGYNNEACSQFKRSVFQNIIGSMQTILDAMERLEIPLADAALADDVAAITKLSDDDQESLKFTQELADSLTKVWGDAGVQTCFKRSREFQLNDSAGYFLDPANIQRVAAADYVPTETDILRVRVKTTGISESAFEHMKHIFRVFDVGGQRSERKKWIHCFEGVTAVIFLVALSEYDLMLREDESTNRMQESLRLFDDICNNKWFVETSMILFLNKTDLFEEKIYENSEITIAFPEYAGPHEFEACREYIRDQFEGLNKHPDKKDVYSHFTCATDTGNIKFIFAAVSDMILARNLKNIGLM